MKPFSELTASAERIVGAAEDLNQAVAYADATSLSKILQYYRNNIYN